MDPVARSMLENTSRTRSPALLSRLRFWNGSTATVFTEPKSMLTSWYLCPPPLAQPTAAARSKDRPGFTLRAGFIVRLLELDDEIGLEHPRAGRAGRRAGGDQRVAEVEEGPRGHAPVGTGGGDARLRVIPGVERLRVREAEEQVAVRERREVRAEVGERGGSLPGIDDPRHAAREIQRRHGVVGDRAV